MPLVTYHLRNPVDADEIYGEDFADEAEALRRALQCADFYQHPVEVCHVIARHIRVGATNRVKPGPTAPLDN
jgi:hypothetical protein